MSKFVDAFWRVEDRRGGKTTSSWAAVQQRGLSGALSWWVYADGTKATSIGWSLRDRLESSAEMTWNIATARNLLAQVDWELSERLARTGTVRWLVHERLLMIKDVLYETFEEAFGHLVDSAWVTEQRERVIKHSNWDLYWALVAAHKASWYTLHEATSKSVEARWAEYELVPTQWGSAWLTTGRPAALAVSRWAVTTRSTRPVEVEWNTAELERNPDWPLTTQSRFRIQSWANRRKQYGVGTKDN